MPRSIPMGQTTNSNSERKSRKVVSPSIKLELHGMSMAVLTNKSKISLRPFVQPNYGLAGPKLATGGEHFIMIVHKLLARKKVQGSTCRFFSVPGFGPSGNEEPPLSSVPGSCALASHRKVLSKDRASTATLVGR